MPFFKDRLNTLYKREGAFKLHVLAFAFSILACASLGILTLFSIFAEPLQTVLGYSQTTINNTIIFQVLGLNVFTPLSGYIADAKGIWILSVISFVGYFIGFNLIILVVKNSLDKYYIYLSFFIIGCSHISFLFSCLLNSAKSLGRYYRTVSISTPNMMISFSSYIQIQILALYFTPKNDSVEEIKHNFLNILRFFLILLMLATLVSLMACKITDWTESFEFENVEASASTHEEFLNFETSPLLIGAGTVLHSPQTSIIGSPSSWYMETDSAVLNLDDELSLLSSPSDANRNGSGASPYRKKVNQFLFDPMMYPLMFCCLMSIGSTEFFISNLSAILTNLDLARKLDASLQLLSISSTLTRFLIMIFTDVICTKFEISRITIFSTCVLLCGFSHVYLSSVPIIDVKFTVVLILNSVLNSAVFTLFPAILASIYGIEILGTTWGICSSSSVFGNMFLNLMYSIDFNSNCVASLANQLVICSTLTFFTSGVLLLFFGLLVFWLRKRYLARAHTFF